MEAIEHKLLEERKRRDESTPPMWSTDEEDREDPEWEWEAPDLKEGCVWYLAWIESISKPVSTLADPDHWYKDGLKCFERHQTNYTEKGPQHLQLLWWEFPCEHWEAL
jgi:hypothetical protein